MAETSISIPVAADTDRKRLAYCLRAWKVLHETKAAIRAKFPAKMTVAEVTKFKKWEKGTWMPKLKRMSPQLCAYREKVFGLTHDKDYPAFQSAAEANKALDSSIPADFVKDDYGD